MALAKYGAGIVQMSGSIAGDVHARNRFGNYIRPRTKPVNPRSARQTVARATLMLLAEQWHESPLDDTKRGAWITYANAINWDNRLGEVVKLTGFNHFCRSNAARMACGLALVDAGPVVLSLPETDNTVTASGSAATQKITITFDDTRPWCTEANAGMSIQMGVPQLPTRNFFNGPWRWSDIILGVSPGGVASPQQIDPGFVLVQNQKVWIKISIIRADARVSTFWMPGPFVCGA